MSDPFEPSHDQFMFPPRAWTVVRIDTGERVLLGSVHGDAVPLFTDEDRLNRYLSEVDKPGRAGVFLPSSGHILIALQNAQYGGATCVVFDPSGPKSERPNRVEFHPIAEVIRTISG